MNEERLECVVHECGRALCLREREREKEGEGERERERESIECGSNN
jgi:hypothetical protein